MFESGETKKPRRILKLLLSFAGHTLFLVIILLIPLMYARTIDLSAFQRTFLVVPPPPPPPPPPPIAAPYHPVIHFRETKLYAPRVIPKQIEQVKEQPPPAQPVSGTLGGVPGGVPGGQWGGVLGGILGSGNQTIPALPAPKPAVHQGPYRIGGRVQPPQIIRQVQPVYPFLANEARVHGEVKIDCVIDEHGNVTQMKVVSGNALLISSALNAVAQWKYQPTLLNGQPVSVDMVVNVTFSLSG